MKITTTLFVSSVYILLNIGNTYAQSPSLSVTAEPFIHYETPIGIPSRPQNFKALVGYDLTGNVTITAPYQYEVSLSPTTGFSNSCTITPDANGNIGVGVFIRFNPTGTAGEYAGDATIASPGASTILWPVSGTAISNLVPYLFGNDNYSLSFNCLKGYYSPIDSIQIGGLNLNHDVVLNTSPYFQLSTSVNGEYLSNLTINPQDVSDSKTIYVRFSPLSKQNFSDSIVATSQGSNQTIKWNVGGNSNFNPSISFNSYYQEASHYYTFYAEKDSISSPKKFGISCSQLQGELTVSASKFYSISFDSTGSFSDSIHFFFDYLTTDTLYFYARYSPESDANYSGLLTGSSPEVATDCYMTVLGKAEFIGNPNDIAEDKLHEVNIYPSLFNNQLHVQFQQEDVKSICIFNALGQKVYHVPIHDQQKELLITTDYFNKGVYFVYLITSKGNAIKKVMKQ